MGLSAGVRKARELGRRSLSLAVRRPGMVVPRARYPSRPVDGVLVLQRGPNPSTDYYLRPRLAGGDAPLEVLDLADPPAASALLAPGGPGSLMVVACRYADPRWLDALEAARGRLARAAFFMDDDLPGMMADAALPRAARGKVALHFGEHVERLGALAGEVWVSTAALAERYPASRPAVLAPVPEAEPPAPGPDAPLRAVYHGTDVHGAERRFVLEVAARLAALVPEARVELTGDAALRREAAGLGNVEVEPQLPWPAFLERQRGRRAAVSLAPLFPSAVNDARAPVKAFDAARLGAAGLYADAPAYRGFVRDGVDGLLLPMRADAWAEAVAGLLRDPVRRLELARAAQARLVALWREPGPLPPAPAA
jgi:hypothetical protein